MTCREDRDGGIRHPRGYPSENVLMAGLFISYRRDDSQGFAGRLAYSLSGCFGPDLVFSDIEIPFGSDFGEVLHRAVAASDALLVVIGRRWAAEAAAGERSRLFEPDDWVRTEVEAALTQGKVVIPVLVGGAAMPAPPQLPASIQRLTHLQAASLETGTGMTTWPNWSRACRNWCRRYAWHRLEARPRVRPRRPPQVKPLRRCSARSPSACSGNRWSIARGRCHLAHRDDACRGRGCSCSRCCADCVGC